MQLDPRHTAKPLGYGAFGKGAGGVSEELFEHR
jgi:hypothetical protein